MASLVSGVPALLGLFAGLVWGAPAWLFVRPTVAWLAVKPFRLVLVALAAAVGLAI